MDDRILSKLNTNKDLKMPVAIEFNDNPPTIYNAR